MNEKIFDIVKVAKNGTTIVIVGRVNCGKTTLIKSVVESLQKVSVDGNEEYYGKKFPFLTVVCAPKNTWEDDYANDSRKLGLRHSFVGFSKGKYQYTKQLIKDNLVVLEDVPAKTYTPDLEKKFHAMLRSLLSQRRRNSCRNVYIIVVQYLSLIPDDLVPDIFHWIFMKKGFNKSKLLEAFECSEVREITKQCKKIGQYEYVVFNTENMTITEPCDTKNPQPIVNLLCDDFSSEFTSIKIHDDVTIKKKIKNVPLKVKIQQRLRKTPFDNIYDIAKDIGTYPQYIINMRCQMRKMGEIPTEPNSEQLKKIAQENRKKIKIKLAQMGIFDVNGRIVDTNEGESIDEIQ